MVDLRRRVSVNSQPRPCTSKYSTTVLVAKGVQPRLDTSGVMLEKAGSRESMVKVDDHGLEKACVRRGAVVPYRQSSLSVSAQPRPGSSMETEVLMETEVAVKSCTH